MDPRYRVDIDIIGEDRDEEWIHYRGPGNSLIPVLEKVLEGLRNLQGAVPQPQPTYPMGLRRCGSTTGPEGWGPCVILADHAPEPWTDSRMVPVHYDVRGNQWVDA
jgi:hypothetical protein